MIGSQQSHQGRKTNVSKLVAIHQPNFFPWLGYFSKIARADLFIILDHVQFPKTKGNWGNRVPLLVSGKPRFFTMPIRRDYHGVRRFNEMLASAQVSWREDLIKTLRTNYARSAHFAEVFSVVEPLILNPIDNLADYNVSAIRALAPRLQIDPKKLVFSSQFAPESQATAMLIDLIRAVGGDGYLCGGGSAGYLEPPKFAEAGLELVFQSYRHPVYPQVGAGEFVPGLSCLDALLNCGFETVASWLHGSARQAKPAENNAA
jgi:hypothetical protein